VSGEGWTVVLRAQGEGAGGHEVHLTIGEEVRLYPNREDPSGPKTTANGRRESACSPQPPATGVGRAHRPPFTPDWVAQGVMSARALSSEPSRRASDDGY
jgi:hypothetical protein